MGLLLAQRYPDGNGFEMFRPLDNTNSAAALIDALRLYIVSGATKHKPGGRSIIATFVDLATPG